MKKTSKVKGRLITAALAATMALTTVTPVMAAESNGTVPAQSISGDSRDVVSYYRYTSERFKELFRKDWLKDMQATKCKVNIHQGGTFIVKNWKLYGRKTIGIAPGGDYIYGKWELLHDRDTITGFSKDTNLEITSDYQQLTFNCDIVWGTDYPFSGVI